MNLESLEGKKISIICGGWSAEREISLKTGKACLLYTSPSPRD